MPLSPTAFGGTGEVLAEPRTSPMFPPNALPSRALALSASGPAKLARCFFIGLPTIDASSGGPSIVALSDGATGALESKGGVVERSVPILGVDAAEVVADLDGFRPSCTASLLSGSAECWRLSCCAVSCDHDQNQSLRLP